MNRLTIVTALTLTLLGASALGVVACDEKKPETAADAAAPATPNAKAAATPASSAAPMAAGGEETEEDFEDEAQASITPDTLESELAKLEAEIK